EFVTMQAVSETADLLTRYDLTLSINISLTDLFSHHYLDFLTQLTQKIDLAPSRIMLEITERENATLAHMEAAILLFKRHGFLIALDDFGTGYSSLSYLEDLNVDILKIDKSFVDALEYKTVTPHIIEMAKTLKLEMVAEGVENESQAQWLREHGVQYAQGWLYSKALPAEAFIAWCKDHGVR
ncbi:EAL domain-containing protein, partial [Staphylococcus aureus]|nr:EAL domain-containing protein [Staphylococcus aureus]